MKSRNNPFLSCLSACQRRASLIVVGSIAALLANHSVLATTLFLDSDGTATAGTGAVSAVNWENASSFWRNGSATGTLQTWSNSGDLFGVYDANLGGANNTVTLTSPITLGKLTILPISGPYTIAGDATNRLTFSGSAVSITATGAFNNNISAPITTGTGSHFSLFGPTGDQALILSGSNAIGGSVMLGGSGKVSLQSSTGALAGATNVTVSSGSALEVNGASLAIGGTYTVLNGRTASTGSGSALQGTGAVTGWGGNIMLATSSSIGARSGTNTTTTGGGVFTISGTISGGSGSSLFINSDAGGSYGNSVVKLSGANTFYGTSVLTGGLNLANQNAMQNSTLQMTGSTGVPSNVVFDSAGGTAFTLGGLSTANTATNSINFGTGFNISLLNSASAPITLSVGRNNTNTTYSGALTGTNGALTKIGTGTLTLGGFNTYSAGTTVNGGTLAADFSLQANTSGSQSDHINASSALTFGGGRLAITGVSNKAAVAATAWTGGVNVGTNLYSLTFGTTPAVVVGQPVTGTGMTGAYVVSIDSTNNKVIVSTSGVPAGIGSDFAATATTTTTSSQTFASTTVNSGGGSILLNPNGGTGTTVNLNSLGTLGSYAAGSSLVVGTALSAGSGTAIVTTTTNKDANGIYGGRIVFANGTADTGYDWATTTTGSSPYTLSAYGGYSALSATTVTNTLNSRISASQTQTTGPVVTNSLKIENPSAGTLALGATRLTLTSGGLLSTGTNAFDISNTPGATGLTAGNGSGAYDLVVHQYNSGGLNISAVIGNNGANATSLTKTGPGYLTLSGINTYTGGTFLNEGTLSIGADNQLGGTGVANNVTLNGGTLQLTASWSNSGNHAIVVGPAGGTINGNGFTLNVTGANGLTGSGPLTLTGSAATNDVLTSGVTKSYTGAMTILNGRISNTTSNVTNNFGTGDITVGAGTSSVYVFRPGSIWDNRFFIAGTGGEGRGVLRLTQGGTFNGDIILTANASMSSDSANTLSTFNGNISGGFTLQLGGAGSANSSAVYNIAGNSSTAGTTVGVGITKVTGSIIHSGSTLALNNASSRLDIASGGSVSFSTMSSVNSSNVNIAGNWTSNAPQATALVNAAGTYTQTAGSGNVLGITTGNAAGNVTSFFLGGASTLTAGKGQYASLQFGGRGTGTFAVSGTAALTVTGDTPAANNAYQLSVGNGNSVFTSPTAGTNSMIQQGGSVVANGVQLGGNTATATHGVYYLNGGTLTTNSLLRGGNAASTGTLNFGGGTFKNGAAFSTDANIATNINSGGATIDTTNGNLTWSGAIAAGTTGNVTGFTSLSGGSGSTPGQVTLGFTGGGSGAAGYAVVNQSGVITDIVITNPGSGYTSAPTITGLSGGATATTTFSTANGGLTKIGANTLTLIGTNTYTGATSVSAGTLLVSGSIGTSDVTLNGGVLASGATGTVGKTVTVNSGATLAAGGLGAVGVASVANDLNFSSGSIFDWDLTTGPGDGTYDTVSVTGALNITSGAKFNVVSSTTYSDNFWDTSHTWSNIFGAKTIDNFLTINFLYSGSSTAPASEGSFTVSGSNLTWTAVPEPTSALVGLLIGAGLLRRRR